jgi:LmbE family N-acetylglucosaminyl deacetylase
MVTIVTDGNPGRAIVGTGTAESDWLRADVLGHLPLFDLDGCSRAVILSPHPDDETLGLGGLIATLAEVGSTVFILAVTDGEASHPNSTIVTVDDLRRSRPRETAEALASLTEKQPGPVRSQRMHLADGHLADGEDILAQHLESLLLPGDWCFAPWEHDGHPDHEATGRAARRACVTNEARLLSYPIWTWHWATPGDRRLPWSRARQLPLSPSTWRRKMRAIAKFHSQIRPLGPAPGDAAVVPPNDLTHFLRPYEVVFT